MRMIRAALAAHVGGLPTIFYWLWGGQFLSAIATFVFPFLALFLTARGLSPSRAGAIVSLFGAGMLVAGPVGGALADRFGRRPTILGGLLGAAATAGALAFLHAPVAIAAVVFLFGVTSQATNAPYQAVIADVVPAQDRGRAFGLAYWANNIGIGVSLVVGGVLATYGWAVPFVADAITTLAFAAIVYRRVPETRPQRVSARGAAAAPPLAGAMGGGSYLTVLADRTFVAFFLLHVAFCLAFWQMQSSLPIDMARHGITPAGFGLVLSVNTFLIAFVQPFGARVTGRFTPAQVLAAASLLVGVGYGAYALCATGPAYALATAVWTLGEIAYMPTASALVQELAPPHLRGRYAGAYGLGFGVASFLAPLAGPAVLEALGAGALWGGCLAVGAAVALGQLALGRARRRSVALRAA